MAEALSTRGDLTQSEQLSLAGESPAVLQLQHMPACRKQWRQHSASQTDVARDRKVAQEPCCIIHRLAPALETLHM
jgi:hypothetical protein